MLWGLFGGRGLSNVREDLETGDSFGGAGKVQRSFVFAARKLRMTPRAVGAVVVVRAKCRGPSSSLGEDSG